MEIKKLKTELEKEQKHTHGLVDFYNEYDAKLEALRHECDEALATAEIARGEAACLSTEITELAKSACYTLRLALTILARRLMRPPPKMLLPLLLWIGHNRRAAQWQRRWRTMVTAARGFQPPFVMGVL